MTGSDVQVVTFGCRLNAYESEVIRARAAEDGVTDAVVFNTCAVTGEAVRQARQAIRKARRENPGARLIVTGCAAQIEPGTFAAMPEVDLVLGNADKARPGALSAGTDGPRVRVNDIMSVRETAGHLIAGVRDRARAYVEVQNGCDHRCTFCVIPFGRGNSRSVPAGEVVEQVRRLTAEGCLEVVLTGVEVTSWGADLPGAPTLGQLAGRILRLVPDLPRLRLSSIDAAEIDPDLMALLADEPRLMPHLHLSLQAGDDMILKRMKRRHSRADALKLVADVRAVRPDVAFGADLIAGFPHRDRGDVRKHPGPGGGGGPGLPACLSLQPPPGHAGRADAPRPEGGGPRARGPAAGGGRGGPVPSPGRTGWSRGPGPGRASRPGPGRGLLGDRLPWRRPCGRDRDLPDRRPGRTAVAGRPDP